MLYRLTSLKTRQLLLMSLVLLAPFSFVPSFAIPLFDFPSFRIGLYQTLAGLFVLVSVFTLWQDRRKIFSRHKPIILAFGLMILIALSGLSQAINLERSGLLVASFILLVAVALSALDVIARSKDLPMAWGRYVLKAGVFYGVVSVAQLISSMWWPSDSLLCKGCGADVFGFVRVNGFAAEPLFWASALLPFFVWALYTVLKSPSRLAKISLGATTFALSLTFARSGYIAYALSAVVLVILLKPALKHLVYTLGLCTGAFLLGWASLVGSAVIRFPDAPYIAYNTTRGMLEHMSLGVINLPEKEELDNNNVDIGSAELESEFVSEGYVEESGSERTGSARLALEAWQWDLERVSFGVGLGNLGPFVVKNIDPNAPSNLTVYIFYVLFLAEMGIVSLFLLLSVYARALKTTIVSTRTGAPIVAAVMVGFLVQYFFFGSYINSVHIWLWLGVALGLANVNVRDKW